MGNTSCKQLGEGTTLLANHEKSEWHLAAVERRAFSQSAEKRGDVIELIVTASEEEKKENQKMMKKLIRSLYFLVKHHIPHTTTFEGLVTLQNEKGDITLKAHLIKSSFQIKKYAWQAKKNFITYPVYMHMRSMIKSLRWLHISII